MNELTIDQALNNIAIVLDRYVGTKQEHIFLEKSFNLIKEAVTPKGTVIPNEVVADEQK